MAGIDNLKTPTAEEARRRGKSGGIASGKARREKKAMRETFEMLLSMPMKDGAVADIEKIKSISALNGKNITPEQAIALKIIMKAIKGDIPSAKLVLEVIGVIGEKQKKYVELSGTVNNPFAGLTTEELKRLIDD